MDTENPTKDTKEAKDMKAHEAATKEATKELLGATETDMVKIIEATINPKMRQALAKCTSSIIA